MNLRVLGGNRGFLWRGEVLEGNSGVWVGSNGVFSL